MTLTGTCVLAYMYAGDALEALASAARLSTAALGLLLRYLTRPPQPGTARADIAASYGLTVSQLRAANAELAAAGYLAQMRRCVGRGQWQHLIVVVDTPGRLPAAPQAWLLLDAALAAEQAGEQPDTAADYAHVLTCGNGVEQQEPTCAPSTPIEPVNPFPADFSSDPARGPSENAAAVATVADLERLAQLPPLPAPREQAHLWLTPGQVLTLIGRYPRRYGELAVAFLARQGLPWYLAPSVVALLLTGYDTRMLARALAGVERAAHPTAAARWRLDRMLLGEPPEHSRWRPPSTYVPDQGSDPGSDSGAVTVRGAALARRELRAALARMGAAA